MGAGSGPLWALGRIVVVTALFAALYLALVILLHRGCAPLNRLARLLREMTSRGELSASAPGSEQVVLGYENSEAEVLVGSEISNHGLSNRG